MIDTSLLVLQAAVFFAALLQAATGIGFGVIAGPVLLIVMNSGAAIQVSMVLSLLIAVLLTPSLWSQVDRGMLKRLLLGSLIGFPLGVGVFLLVEVDVLKILAGLSVLYMTGAAAGLFAKKSSQKVHSDRADYGVGVISGAMNTSLAMPGPVVAAHMTSLARGKVTTRATILVTFVASYLIAIAFQAVLVGVSSDAVDLTLILAPATVIGVVIGRIVTSRISEAVFRRLIVVVLAATSLSLLVNAVNNLFGIY